LLASFIITLFFKTALFFWKTDGDALHFCRKNLYVWSLVSGELMKVLDAHFGRIIALEPLIIGNWNSVSTHTLKCFYNHGNSSSSSATH
jgi:hypothetical protein